MKLLETNRTTQFILLEIDSGELTQIYDNLATSDIKAQVQALIDSIQD